MIDMSIAIEYSTISVVFVILCKMLARFPIIPIGGALQFCKLLTAALILENIVATDVYIISV